MARKVESEENGSAGGAFGKYWLAEKDRRLFKAKVFRAMITMSKDSQEYPVFEFLYNNRGKENLN